MEMDRRTLMKGAAALAGGAMWGAEALAAAPDARSPALRALVAYMAAHRETLGLPGLTACVVDGDQVDILTSGYADVDRGMPVQPDHLFQIGSISKSFVGIAILQAIARGALGFETEGREILPDVRWPDGVKITVRHLLNHSSGLPDNSTILSRGYDRLWVGYAPGTHWSYSNLGYDLLGLMLEKLEGRPLAEILEARIFNPLGMTATKGAIMSVDRAAYATGYGPLYRDRPYPRKGKLGTAAWIDTTSGAGAIASTPGDMAKYIRWLVSAWKGKGAPLMPDDMTKSYFGLTQDAPDWAPDTVYACGLAIMKEDGRTFLQHTGGMVSFSSSLHVDVESGIGCFASTNEGFTDYRPTAITWHACYLLRALREARPLPDAPRIFHEVPEPEKFAGVFRDAAGNAITFSVEGKKLFAGFGGDRVEVQTVGESSILIPRAPYDLFPIRIVRDGDRIASLWYGGTQFARHTRDLADVSDARLLRLAGRYDNDDPWEGVIRVAAQGDDLYLWGTEKLTLLADGSYRPGDEDWSPERLRFDADIGGKIRRLSLSGTDYLRREG